jgi:hypothetical protein
VHIRLLCEDGEKNYAVAPNNRVTPTSALMGDLKALLGPSAVSA